MEVPRGDIIRRESSLEAACGYVGYPLVVKPVGGNHGRGITVNIKNYEDALGGISGRKRSFQFGHHWKIYYRGRLPFAGHQLQVVAAAAELLHMVGDGKSTVKAIGNKVNEDPRRVMRPWKCALPRLPSTI